MATVVAPPEFKTVADLVEHFGGIPVDRIRVRPTPGTATEADVIRVHEREKRLCELVDGVLLEKPMGAYESRLAVILLNYLETFTQLHELSELVSGGDVLPGFSLDLAAVFARADAAFPSGHSEPAPNE